MSTKSRRLNCVALGIAVLVAMSSFASAQPIGGSQVTASLSSREAYVGVPITLQIEVTNATQSEPPEIPAIDGLRVESLGAPSRSSQTTIINGHRTDRVSVTYAWRVTPRAAGRYVIPALDVPMNGSTQRTRPLTFVATKSETGDLLFAEVSGTAEAIYVGQALPVTLKIWIKPFRDESLGVKLSEADMWQFVLEDPASLGVFGERLAEMSKNRERPIGQEVLRKDSHGEEHSYYLYEVETTFYPKRPGAIDIGEVQVVVSYPTGLGRSRDVFSIFENRLAVTGTRPIVADASVSSINVKPIPTTGRPDDYRGAVGHYQIATQASPILVKAGDPITLHIGVHGDGPMDLVQAPPLATLPELTRNFRVPNEPLAGIVEDGIKVFSVSIRPERAGVKEIPPIPLTYFDPNTEQFVTVKSDPIAIHVDPADTLELPAMADSEDAGSSDTAALEPLTFENSSDLSILRSSSPISIWSVVAFVIAGPLLFFGTWFVRRCWWSDSGWTGPRLRRPITMAQRAVAAAKTPRELSQAILTNVAKQLNVAADSLTRTEAISGLRQLGYSEGLAELDSLLAQCDQMSYASTGIGDISNLSAAGQRCLSTLKLHV